MLVCLQPLSQYKKKDLYRYVDSFELTDPSLFEDAVITENLCICTLKKDIADKYSWIDMTLASYDQKYVEYYKACRTLRNKSIVYLGRPNTTTFPDPDYKVDFITSIRAPKDGTYAGHSEMYEIKWQQGHLKKEDLPVSTTNGQYTCLFIHFSSEQALSSFIKYYRKSGGLMEKTLLGLHKNSGSISDAIPQIDWSNIHINQKELWDKGLYDEAVLAEMGLKWNADKTVIVKDE